MTDYVPIDCGLHSEYERAILQKQRLQIVWRDPDGTHHIETIAPLDLLTSAGEEFLVGHTATGARLEIRLDYISNHRKA